MVKNNEERYRWFKAQKDLFAQPGCEATEVNGKLFARTLAKICPHCGDTFYAYQVLGRERQPNRQDPMPVQRDLAQTRETCGSPKCWDDEIAVQFRRTLASHRRPAAPASSTPEPKLQRRGQAQPLKNLKESGL